MMIGAGSQASLEIRHSDELSQISDIPIHHEADKDDRISLQLMNSLLDDLLDLTNAMILPVSDKNVP